MEASFDLKAFYATVQSSSFCLRQEKQWVNQLPSRKHYHHLEVTFSDENVWGLQQKTTQGNATESHKSFINVQSKSVIFLPFAWLIDPVCFEYLADLILIEDTLPKPCEKKSWWCCWLHRGSALNVPDWLAMDRSMLEKERFLNIERTTFLPASERKEPSSFWDDQCMKGITCCNYLHYHKARLNIHKFFLLSHFSFSPGIQNFRYRFC